MDIHVVRRGDTLAAIARQHGVDADWIARNNRVRPEGLVVGQTLVILHPAQSHTAAAGESLYTVARRYGVSVNRLWRNNLWLGGRSALRAGESLVIRYREQPQSTLSITGYIYPQVDWGVLRQALPFANILMPFTYGFAQDGSLVTLNDRPFVALAREYGAEPYLHLSTLTPEGTFSSDMAARLFESDAMQRTLIGNIMEVVHRVGYSGVDVDFEYIEGRYAAHYAAFLARLKRSLGDDMGLIVAVAPKERADQKGLLYEGHDYAALGAIADGVLVMTYEWGYTFSSPRAVAPTYWIRRVLDYAVTAIPPEKIYMGMPNYGYDWPLPWVEGETRAKSLGNYEAVQLAARHGAEIFYDESGQAPYFHYTDGSNVRHEVWFEDARSVRAKLEVLDEYRLLGAGYWNLMRPFPQNWLVVNGKYADLR